MGGYSSDSGSEMGRKKKKRRRRSSSSSSSASSHSRLSNRNQRDKGRTKRDSPERKYHSKSSRSRSHSKDRKVGSRSSSTHSYSSSSKARHSRRSRSRSRDRKDVKDSKRDSKSDRSNKKGYNDDSSKRKHGLSPALVPPSFPYEAKSPEEQLKLKMQLALKAAADADAALREQGILLGKGKAWNYEEEEEKLASTRLPQLSGIEQMDRAKALDAINAPGFQQASFRTGSKSVTPSQAGDKLSLGNHDAAMFGVGTDPNIPGIDGFGIAAPTNIVIDKDSIAHENLFVDSSIKEERWIRKLMFMRQRKLNGEAMF